MNHLKPINQVKLFGLGAYFNELALLYNSNKLPNKILLSGQKGQGKSTLSYHFINYILSKGEKFQYDLNKLEINTENHTFKTIHNKSNPNLILIDINEDKKIIDINQIRSLISCLNKSSFNKKPRFVLIDNIEFLNISSVNALLKVVEEPSENVYFILINNNKNILPTLISRCINFKIFLSFEENINISEKLLDAKLYSIISKDLINYYSTPGNIYNLAMFAKINDYNLDSINLNNFLKIIIENRHYKKDGLINHLIFDFIEFYLTKIDLSISSKISTNYNYFVNKISNVKRFNLDEESLFAEFNEILLNE